MACSVGFGVAFSDGPFVQEIANPDRAQLEAQAAASSDSKCGLPSKRSRDAEQTASR